MAAVADRDDSWYARVTQTYNMLWQMIIRPPRDLYAQEDLGPRRFRIGKRVFERRDLQLQSSRGHKLECSHFYPAKSPEARRPCVVYLHGNCSSRLEAFDVLPVLLPRGITVFCMDLSGSGRSDGEYISLGFHEEKDLRVALQHLRDAGRTTAIGLWGRSMGAATAILRAADDHQLSAIVSDSCFRDLRTVAEELVNRGRIWIPSLIVTLALELVRSEVRSRAEFDPDTLEPLKFASLAVCPALFGCASDDTFVLPHHTEELHQAWAGESVLHVFDGGHNGARPTWFLEEAAAFLVERLRRTERASRQHGSAEEDSVALSTGRGPTPREPPTLQPNRRPLRGPSLNMAEELFAAPGPVPTTSPDNHSSVTSQRSGIANQLAAMGFRQEAAVEASRRSASMEGALDWLLRKSTEALTVVDMRPPSHASPPRGAGLEVEDGSGTARDAAEEGGANPVPKSAFPGTVTQSRLHTPGGDQGPTPWRTMPEDFVPAVAAQEGMAGKLRDLGFTTQQVEEAMKSCSSVEVAVDWLSMQGETVRL
eukprot:gnl/TRDRNA2_/TRDRNA2_162259_c0_seq1.p1 gnl/TRDRNA2_/TRDRNA2_162259_c0~~gnl/TRDRNA2_/TRDRNA2_162259_c0_seq1.p1  ORF type:complete len:538 (-),score=78.72 gnl/TRDRNA2_/TRDRNA2_162259_c0_seq1:59-1672(-)